MPEKSANSVSSSFSWNVLWLNPMIHWSFKVLTFSVFLVILIVWGIDGWSASNSQIVFKIGNKSHTQDYFAPNAASVHPNISNLNQTQDSLSPYIGSIHPNIRNLNQTQKNSTIPTNLTQDEPRKVPAFSDWISVELDPYYTSNLLSGWLSPGGVACNYSKTADILIPDLDSETQIELSTGEIHEFVFQALDEAGKPNCVGGDYFEFDVSGDRWKSRPSVKDFNNGTYSFSLQIHPDFAGYYNLTVVLLFRHYEGLRFSPHRFAVDKELRRKPIKFYKSPMQLPQLTACSKFDFSRNVWSGRWTRHGENESCSVDNEGRFRCLGQDFPCQVPWCHGALGLLESNGWTYSTHCSFSMFSSERAWSCLSGKWLFFWGDSNHCDTIRNMLHFILDMWEIKVVPRRFDMNVTNPRNSSQVVRISSIFNGHQNESANYNGLNSLQDDEYKEFLKMYFSGVIVPDTIIMNSGLHDGVFWRNIRRFTEGAERAAAFWAEVVGAVRERGVVPPEVIYRTTVATGGYARSLAFNPSKMEAFNGVFLEKLRKFGVVNWVVDDFDMTWPWHFDNRCNDGVHYGRAPAKMLWRDGQIGHQYFVDLMLGHVLLNALCAR
ncbi:hypothetical protein RHGRI_012389 [Rhododendron griersonianum]|uniref:Uncharacterized protein n=1 Tax=Rhododendron griersonianum TaxID=479676 RepID=A0AAV6KRD1_9ERIC|nr:hypothetical protein RHGRI_012389 [Rhododendron griersonianum]